MKSSLIKIIGRQPAVIGQSLKSIAKMMLKSRRKALPHAVGAGERLIVLGNGPSLNDTIASYGADVLQRNPTMAVNFAANAAVFVVLQPRYYIMADPVFFEGDDNEKVRLLWQNLADNVSWPMTLFVPMERLGRVRLHNPLIEVRGFNFVGLAGASWLIHSAFDRGLGMPRPRNVLIPAIMTGLLMGYREIYICGADHSWTRTLSVDGQNRLVTVQPHFYKDGEDEARRIEQVYRDIHMHDILLSFHIAFKSYFAIERYARSRGADIYNATPGSFIDAFRRRSLESLRDEDSVGQKPDGDVVGEQP